MKKKYIKELKKKQEELFFPALRIPTPKKEAKELQEVYKKEKEKMFAYAAEDQARRMGKIVENNIVNVRQDIAHLNRFQKQLREIL